MNLSVGLRFMFAAEEKVAQPCHKIYNGVSCRYNGVCGLDVRLR